MPASYPTAVKVWSDKVDLTDINYAVHINDLQAEVAAIETALGVNPHASAARSTNYASLDARLEALETGYAPTSHTHDHGSLTGLSDDDHPQYVKKAPAGGAKGTILVHNGTELVPLAIGADGTVLAASSAASTGAAWASGVSAAAYTAKGVVLVGTGAGTFQALAIGADGTVLTADSTQPKGMGWGSPTSGIPAGTFTTAGDLLLGSGAGSYARLGRGTEGQMLLSTATTLAHGNNPQLAGYSEKLTTNATASGAISLDVTAYNVVNHTLVGGVTYTLTAPPSGRAWSLTIYATQDGTGGHTITWPSSVKWSGGTEEAQDTTANRTSVYVLTTVNGGTTWIASLAVKGAG